MILLMVLHLVDLLQPSISSPSSSIESQTPNFSGDIGVADLDFDPVVDQLANRIAASLYLSYQHLCHTTFNREFTLRLEGNHFVDKIAVFNEFIAHRFPNPNGHEYSNMLQEKKHDNFIFVQFTDRDGIEVDPTQMAIKTPEGGHFFRFVPEKEQKITFRLDYSHNDE